MEHPQPSAQTQTVQCEPIVTSSASYGDEPYTVVKEQSPSVESARRQSPLETTDNDATSREGHVNKTTIVTTSDIQINPLGRLRPGGVAVSRPSAYTAIVSSQVKDQYSAELVPFLSARDDQAPYSHEQSIKTDKTRCGPEIMLSPLPSTASETLTAECRSSEAPTGGQSVVTEHQDNPSEILPEDDIDLRDDDFPSSLPPSSSPAQIFSSSPFCSSQLSVVQFEAKDGDDGRIPTRTVDIIFAGTPVPEVEPTVLEQLQDVCLPSPMEEVISNSGIIAETEALGKVCLDSNKKDVAQHYSLPSHLGKRPLTGDTVGLKPSPNNNPVQCVDYAESARLSKRLKMKVEGYSPPAPRRSTLASQRCQYRKLIAPFRSPLRLPVDNVTQMAKRDQKPDRESSTKSQEQHQTTPPTYLENKLTTTSTARTSKVAAQFKSPILASGVPPDSRCTLRLTPAIQKLERKLQLLKRAIKVKEDNEEEILNRLAKKWTDAGREVAYELWDLIKFAGTFPNNTPSFGNSWGWDTAAPSAENQDSRLSQTDLEAGFFKERLDYVEDDNGTLPTLGTMLRVHGIAAETLGWDDETETFRD